MPSKDLDFDAQGWSITPNLARVNEVLAQIGPVAIGFRHNQVLQVGVLRVEPITADSKLSKKVSYREYFAKKRIHLQRGGLRFISVTNAPGSKHPVELARVFDLEDTRLAIQARKGAQIGNERRVLLARSHRK
ncbi:unnamed protein product [Caenorhabditis brenneri]